MSLKRTYKSVTNLECENRITTAQMLDFIALFVEEVFDHNGVDVGNVSALAQGDHEALIINAYVLSNLLVSVVRQNEKDILEWDDSAELQAVFSQIKEINSELEKKSEAAKVLCTKKEILEVEQKQLKEKNEKLLNAQKECEVLEEDIRKLNDPILAGMEQRRDELRDELVDRRKKYEEINTAIREYDLKIDEINKNVVKAQNEQSMKETKYGEILKQKENLERTIQELDNKKSECEAWISEFKITNAEMIRNSEEYWARYAQIYTAINSICEEKYIKEHLFSVGDRNKMNPANYPDLSVFPDKIENIGDFQEWIKRLQNRIESLLKVYQEELKQLVECSEIITKGV